MSRNGARVLLECLLEEGVDTIFGYPGGAVLPIYDALYDSPIRHILVRHEQGAVHAAQGYARVSGKVGVCLATSGPGATNLVTGLTDAYMDSTPVVAITGQVPVSLIGSDAFQEADTAGITRGVTKYNYMVKDAKDLPAIIHEAFYLARSGRPGPVLIDIPKDVSLFDDKLEHPKEPPRRRGYRIPYQAEPGEVDQAIEAMRQARRPLIIVGGGVIQGNAVEHLRRFVTRAGMPAISTLMGLGALPGLHPLHLGMVGMHGTFAANRATVNADLIIGLGLRFDDRVTGNATRFAPKAKIIHVDIDPAEINKNVRADYPVIGDLTAVLPEFMARLENITLLDYTGWFREIREWQEHQGWTAVTPMEIGGENGEKLKPQRVIQEVYKITEGKAIIATDVGQHQMWTALLYPFAEPRTFVTSGGLGTMGFGFPAALGAQVAAPDREVWLITGDGSFQMNLQELATASNYGLAVKVVVINNNHLGMVRQWQELFHHERYSHVDIGALPDYVKLAEAYSATGYCIRTRDELFAGLKAAKETPGVVLLDVKVEAQENVFPMVPAGATLQDVILKK